MLHIKLSVSFSRERLGNAALAGSSPLDPLGPLCVDAPTHQRRHLAAEDAPHVRPLLQSALCPSTPPLTTTPGAPEERSCQRRAGS